jgi:hypothetical protein
MKAFEKNPRISYRTLYKEYSTYRGVRTVIDLVNRAFENQVLLTPRIYVNVHTDIELPFIDQPFPAWEDVVKDEKVSYAVLLSGAHRLFALKTGATILTYSESIIPTYPAIKRPEEIYPNEKGFLEQDKYPIWNDLEWDVYRNMGNPRTSFVDVGKRLGVSWQTVKNHYDVIMKDAKVSLGFFPKGLQNYYHLFLTFKTEYEVGFKVELEKLDRSSFLFKGEGMLMLFIYVERPQDLCRRFSQLEKEGIVRDVRVSIPIQWYKP